jgi:hypothetical protein
LVIENILQYPFILSSHAILPNLSNLVTWLEPSEA